MIVNLEDALVVTQVQNEKFYVINSDGYFKVYWCNDIKHYKIEKMK